MKLELDLTPQEIADLLVLLLDGASFNASPNHYHDTAERIRLYNTSPDLRLKLHRARIQADVATPLRGVSAPVANRKAA